MTVAYRSMEDRQHIVFLRHEQVVTVRLKEAESEQRDAGIAWIDNAGNVGEVLPADVERNLAHIRLILATNARHCNATEVGQVQQFGIGRREQRFIGAGVQLQGQIVLATASVKKDAVLESRD